MNFDKHLFIRTNNSVILHTKRMHCIMCSSVACLAVSYFATPGLYYKRNDFGINFLNIKFLFGLSLQRLSDIFLILRTI